MLVTSGKKKKKIPICHILNERYGRGGGEQLLKNSY